jgi:hypothetical protein
MEQTAADIGKIRGGYTQALDEEDKNAEDGHSFKSLAKYVTYASTRL